MARSFSASTSNYIGASAALVTAAPLILAGWAKPASTSGAYTILSITDSASDQNHFDLTQLNNTMLAECKDTVTSSASVSGVTSGAWQHFAAAFLSGTSRYAYRNGTPGTEETTSRTPSAAALNKTTVGLLRRLTLNFPYNGDIGPCAVYAGASITKAVADDIIGQLARGRHPRDVRPDLLVECWDLTDRGSTLIGMMGAMALNVTGTCNPTDNPLIIRRRPQAFEIAAAGGGGSIGSGDGSSSGVGAASGVGASTAASAGSSAGTGAASATGASTAAAVGSASGVGAASAVGADAAAGSAGSSAGTSSASGVGASTAASVGSSSGVGAANGVAQALQTIAAVGSSSGTATAIAVGSDASVQTASQTTPGIGLRAARTLEHDPHRDIDWSLVTRRAELAVERDRIEKRNRTNKQLMMLLMAA